MGATRKGLDIGYGLDREGCACKDHYLCPLVEAVFEVLSGMPFLENAMLSFTTRTREKSGAFCNTFQSTLMLATDGCEIDTWMTTRSSHSCDSLFQLCREA